MVVKASAVVVDEEEMDGDEETARAGSMTAFGAVDRPSSLAEALAFDEFDVPSLPQPASSKITTANEMKRMPHSLVRNTGTVVASPTLEGMESPRGLNVARLWDEYGQRLMRYGGVTIVSTVIGFSTLLIGLYVFDLPGVAANFLSVLASTPPAYYLNRRWVWGQGTGNHSATKEVAPFWMMTLLGFLISTIAIAIVDTQTDSKPLLLFTQVASFGALWLLKFAFLEKVLWKDSDDRVHEPV